MENDTDTTPPEPQKPPRPQTILEPRRRRDDLSDTIDMPQDAAAAALPQFMRLPPDMNPDTITQILGHIEAGMMSELDGDPAHMNRMLVENSALFDLAARYYFSGGETGKINDANFKSAMKASRLSMEALKDFRQYRLQTSRLDIRKKAHEFEMKQKEFVQSEFMEKVMYIYNTNKSYYRDYFDKKELKMAEQSRSHD